MRKKTLLKTMFMLCALVVGNGSVWAQSDMSAIYTSNVTLPSSGTNVSSCVVIINSTNYTGTKLGKSGSGASASFTAPAGTKYIHLHVAGWNGKTPGFKYKVGTGSEVTISGITSNSGIANNSPFTFSGDPSSSEYYKVITLSSALESATSITFTSTSERVVFWGVNTEVEESYTITAVSNNDSYGTVSKSGNVITGSPVSGYRYANPAYTVTTGTASVSQSGNNFTVTPSTDCTVQINFEPIPTHTATFSVNGTTRTQNYAEGAAISFPSDPAAICGKGFVGWVATPIVGTTDTAPTFVSSATMSTSDVTYYAVFASESETTAWRKLAASNVSEGGIYALLTTDGKAFNGTISSGHGQATTNAFSFDTNDIAISAPTGTCEITLQPVTGGFKMYNAGNGYLYAKANSSGNLAWHNSENSYWSYANSNWKYNSNGAYLRSYDNNSFRTYNGNTGVVLVFAKKITILSYSGYCTSITGTITLYSACTDGTLIYGTYYTNHPYVMHEDLVGQIVSVVSVNNESKLSVLDAYEGGDVVPANTALLIATADGFITETKDYTIAYTGEDGEDWSDYNMLKGTLTADETTTGTGCLFYRLTMHQDLDDETKPLAIGFWWGAEGGGAFAPGANKAYLAVPEAKARTAGFSLFGDGEATGVKDLKNSRIDGLKSVYDLQGRRVQSSKFFAEQSGKAERKDQSSKLKPGLYIKDGKKVFMK